MPLPSLSRLGSGLGGLATVLGLGLEGYSKDQATRVENERNRQRDLESAQALQAQMDEHNANVEARKAATALAQQKVAANKNAFARLAIEFPDHPDLAGGYTEGGQWNDVLTAARAQKKSDADAEVKGRAGLAALGSTFSNDPVVQSIVKQGYTPGLTDALPAMWESARQRYGLANAYHPDRPEKGQWARDTATDTDVWVMPDQLASAPPGKYAKPGAVGGGGGSLTPTAIQGMYEDMNRLDVAMKKYEKDHPEGIGAVATLLGPAAQQKPTDFKSALEKSAANWGLGKGAADYQTYQQNTARFGNILSQVNSKRGTEYQSVLDIAQTGQAAGDAPGAIASKQAVRANALLGRPKPPPGWKPGAQTTTPAAPDATQQTTTNTAASPAGAYSNLDDGAVWDQAVRESGMAAVLKEFGTRAQYIARNKR